MSWGNTFGELIVVGDQKNNIVDFLEKNNQQFKLFNNHHSAIDELKNGDMIMFLDTPSEEKVSLDKTLIEGLKKRDIKVYIELPFYLSELTDGVVYGIDLERVVVSKNVLDNVDSLSILSLNNHEYFRYKDNNNSKLRIAKVAGFDKADYGFKGVESYPLLFTDNSTIISSSKLSDFVTSRSGPIEYWKELWKFVFQELGVVNDLAWEYLIPSVRPSKEPFESISSQDYFGSIKRGAEWYFKSRLLIHESWQDLLDKNTAKNGEGVVYPSVSKNAPIGDGSFGILEGHSSYIYKDGSQPIRWWVRADCQAETAFALSSSSLLLNNQKYKEVARNLLDYLFKSSNLRADERNDPKSPSYGLVGWATTDPDAYYGDDNAKVILATIGASVNLETDSWSKYIIEAILGNFRTAGKNGFRGPWFRDASMQKTTWEELGQREIINIHPHYESWLWATYLWLYDKVKFEPLKEKAIEAISITMENFPNWKWTNGIQQEYARMILPLAWLVRVEDNELHRKWLDQVVEELLKGLDESGAIEEKLGSSGLGRYDKIQSNQEYGLKEAPLISNNGDKVTDLLYTLNYGAFSLQEAAAATGDLEYKKAVNKIVDFLVKVQVRSEKHPELDGAWFRAFDFGRWEYWASNADSGWGPWGTQTGWTQSWIMNSIVLNYEKSNFWDRSKEYYHSSSFEKIAKQKINEMLNK